jgi:hypothetical protein
MSKSKTQSTKNLKLPKTQPDSLVTFDVRNPTLIEEELEHEMQKHIKEQSVLYENLVARVQALEEILESVKKENLINIECENFLENP